MLDGNIAVFGGNGLTGSEVVYQALDRGCRVTAFCRDPSKLKVHLRYLSINERQPDTWIEFETARCRTPGESSTRPLQP